MNKTVSINLSGQVFQVDEQAYDKLRNYLESIRRHFSVSDGGQEIISDIEARIAEVFSEKLNDRKQVVTLADVEDMMQHMGKPEDFDSMGEPQEQDEWQNKATRRLFRDPDEKLLAGICSGLSAYLGIADPLWLRLIFVLALIFGFGSPILIYIILWLIVPEAKTASEKLQMRGENINISNIEKTIKDDLNDLKDRINNIHHNRGTKRAKNFFASLIGLVINIFAFAFKLVFKLTALLLIIIGLLIIFALITIIAVPTALNGFTLSSLYPLLFASQTIVFLGLLGAALFIGIPALMLTLLGFRILMGHRRRVKGLGVSLFGMWLVGLGLVIFTAAKTGAEFRADESLRTEIPIYQPSTDTLYLDGSTEAEQQGYDGYELFDHGYFTMVDSMYYVSGRIRLDIVKSLTGNYQLIEEVSSYGKNRANALGRAEAVAFSASQSDSVLHLGSHFTFPMEHRFRGQKIQLTLKVPEGKSVFISSGVHDILYDVKNVTDTYDGDMIGHTWTMLPAGLTCLDCNFASREESESGFPEGKVSREFDFNDFTAIDAGGPFSIEVKQGSDFQVSATGTEHFIHNLEISEDGGNLHAHTKGGFRFFRQEGRCKVIITLPELSSLKISGANQTEVSGFKGDKMDMEVTGASEVEVKSSFKRMELKVSGASVATLSGTGTDLNATLNGTSRLKAFNYEIATCDIDVNGASKAEVNVNTELRAEVNGASEILYKGLPKISSDVTGFSSMKPSK